jgi:hypothetical protein
LSLLSAAYSVLLTLHFFILVKKTDYKFTGQWVKSMMLLNCVLVSEGAGKGEGRGGEGKRGRKGREKEREAKGGEGDYFILNFYRYGICSAITIIAWCIQKKKKKR